MKGRRKRRKRRWVWLFCLPWDHGGKHLLSGSGGQHWQSGRILTWWQHRCPQSRRARWWCRTDRPRPHSRAPCRGSHPLQRFCVTWPHWDAPRHGSGVSIRGSGRRVAVSRAPFCWGTWRHISGLCGSLLPCRPIRMLRHRACFGARSSRQSWLAGVLRELCALRVSLCVCDVNVNRNRNEIRDADVPGSSCSPKHARTEWEGCRVFFCCRWLRVKMGQREFGNAVWIWDS